MIGVNLLPPKFVRRRLVRKRIRQWAFVFGLIAIVFSAWNTSCWVRWWKVYHELQELNLAAAPIRQLQTKRLELAKKANLLEVKLNQLRIAAADDRTVSTLGVIAKGVLATDRSVQVQEMQVSLSSANSKRNYLVSIRGIAVQGDSITAFMQSLSHSGMFPTVDLRSTQERIIADQPIQEFQLECLSDE